MPRGGKVSANVVAERARCRDVGIDRQFLRFEIEEELRHG